jgi:hypothetical protein
MGSSGSVAVQLVSALFSPSFPKHCAFLRALTLKLIVMQDGRDRKYNSIQEELINIQGRQLHNESRTSEIDTDSVLEMF